MGICQLNVSLPFYIYAPHQIRRRMILVIYKSIILRSKFYISKSGRRHKKYNGTGRFSLV